MRNLNLAFIGFGNVGRAFAKLLKEKGPQLRNGYHLNCKVTGVLTRREGAIVSRHGLNLTDLCDFPATQPVKGRRLNNRSENSVSDFIRKTHSDILFEITTLNPKTGQPAIHHIETALKLGVHVVTANKGPLAFAYRDLSKLAQRKKVALKFEGTVMDGTPIFSLILSALPCARILSFEAILNSTTNFILSEMECGISFDRALKTAQAREIVESDPSYDVDGWDAATKAAVIVNVLMGGNLTPLKVKRTGIRGLKQQHLRKALRSGKRIKLIARGFRKGKKVYAGVAPVHLTGSHIFARLGGTSSAITFRTDTIKEITIVGHNPSIRDTAYALFSDMIAIASGMGA